jgi:hypothetical protein
VAQRIEVACVARLFSLYGKKRGGRRTGSQPLASLLTAIFFGLSFFGGLGFASVALTRYVVPEWRVNQSFRDTECEVLKTRVREAGEGADASFRPEVQIRYEVNDTPYETWTYDISGVYSADREASEKLARHFVVGQRYPCWYDPQDPATAVLVRGYTWVSWLTFLLPLAFVSVGGGGLAYMIFDWGKSAERRAARSGLPPVARELFEANGRASQEYPFVPTGNGLTDSPGTTLKFRLPTSTQPTWTLALWLLGAVSTATVVAVFVVMAVRRHLDGTPDWSLTFFTIPWIAVTVAIGYQALRRLLIHTGIGPTCVEVSGHPLRPGEHFAVMLSQTGRLNVNWLNLSMVCCEQATYQQGTNTRTDRRKVFEAEIFRRENFQIQGGVAFAARCEFTLPHQIMHSFRAEHNSVDWNFVVRGNLAGWPDFERQFPVVVYPAQEQRASR